MTLYSRLRYLFEHRAIHVTRRGLMIAAAIVAVLLVSLVTIDLGPGVRRMAEERGSTAIKRPIHIGRLSIHLLTGRVFVDNVVDRGAQAVGSSLLHGQRIWPWRSIGRRSCAGR